MLENTEVAIKNVQDEVKQNENTTQYVMDTTIRKQTQITCLNGKICEK
jgi:hypothetical protein